MAEGRKSFVLPTCFILGVQSFQTSRQTVEKAGRRNRCKIKSPKTGKEIQCPYSCYSKDCPKKRQQTVSTNSEVFIEDLQENEGFEVGGIDYTSTSAIANVMREEFISILKKDDPVPSKVFSMQDYGKAQDGQINILQPMETHPRPLETV